MTTLAIAPQNFGYSLHKNNIHLEKFLGLLHIDLPFTTFSGCIFITLPKSLLVYLSLFDTICVRLVLGASVDDVSVEFP